MQAVQLANAIREYAGLWVAVRNGEVVETAESPGLLSMRLHDREITDATIVRSPRLDEPELVGLG
jgi:hypothetical protein